VFGALLAAIGVGRLPWMPVLFCLAGMLISLTLLELHRRYRSP
jgi:hypothetical protein